MRKLLWVSLTGLTLLGGVTTAAYLTMPRADPAPGRQVRHASASSRPGERVVAQPVCASRADSSDLVGGACQALPTANSPAPIVIPEHESSARVETGTHDHLLVPSRDPGMADAVVAAPVLMPYCDGASVEQAARPRAQAVMQPVALTSEPGQMDYARESEPLPMPSPAEETAPLEGAEEQEEPGAAPMPTGAAGKLIRGMEQMLKRSGEAPATTEPLPADGRQDPHPHHHSGCPYTGGSTCPVSPRPQPSNPGESKQSSLYRIRLLPGRAGSDEQPPLAVDTAEMRPEDRLPGETIPGAL